MFLALPTRKLLICWWLLGTVLFLFLYHAASRPFGWGDLFWQIKTGELVWQTQQIRHTDPFTFTAVGKEWVEHEWLTDVLDYGVHSLGGLLAIRLFFTSLWLLVMIHLFRVFRRLSGDLVLGLVFTVVVTELLVRQFIPAPSTLSLFLFFWMVLLVAPWKPRRSPLRILSSVLLFYLWCNMHSVALLMLGFLGLFAILPFCQQYFGTLLGQPTVVRPGADRWALFFACLGVSFLTPFGYKIHLYALFGPTVARFVDEWKPLFGGSYVAPFFQSLFAASALLWITTAALRIKKTGWAAWLSGESLFFDLSSLFCIWLGAAHARFIWLGAVPLVATAYDLRTFFPAKPWAFLGLGATLFTASSVAVGWSPIEAREVFTQSYYVNNLRMGVIPAGAADYLITHPLEGNLFNHYIWGGYLIYRLYPTYKVFIDGRTVLHGDEILMDEMKISAGSPETAALLDKYKIRILIVGPKYLDDRGASELGFKTIFRDEASAVYYR